MDNYRILGKSVEIKVSSKMAGYKMNLPFNAEKETRDLLFSGDMCKINLDFVFNGGVGIDTSSEYNT